jgi:hypothetical protein
VQRTAQQRRADVFAELPGRQLELLRAMHKGQQPVLPAQELTERAVQLLALPVKDRTVLNIHLPVTTPMGLDHCPARIEGAGPIDSGQLHALYPIAKVRRVFVDAATGTPIAMDAHLQPPLAEVNPVSPPRRPSQGRSRGVPIHPDRLRALFQPTTHCTAPEPQHDPSAALARLVRTRDLGCVGPGCPLPARLCQLDHLIEYGKPGGVTSAANLDPLTLGCHLNKHEGWHLERNPNGTSTWYSPLGGVYTRRPRWQPPPLHRRETLRSKDPARNRYEPPPPSTDPSSSWDDGHPPPF